MEEIVYSFASGRVRRRTAAEPAPAEGEALLRTLLVGIDGTDEAVVSAGEGEPPMGREEMVLGHECLAEVVSAPDGCGLRPGDRVVPLVRHGCGDCAACAAGAADLCKGSYVEHGIKGLDGFLRPRWTDDPASLVPAPRALGRLAILTEPLSVVVKGFVVAGHVQRRLPNHAGFAGGRALVAGTGSLGSLAALLLRDEGMDVWAMDRSGPDTLPARLLAEAGVAHLDAREGIAAIAQEHDGFDLVVEATGSARVAFELVRTLEPNGILVLTGVPVEKPAIELEADDLVRDLVLGNRAVVGTVNSNRGHFEEAMRRLASFRRRWNDLPDRLLTHTFPADDAEKALTFDDDSLVKKVVAWVDAP